MTQTQKILVTGATGTVGRQVVAELLARGHAVRALTRDAKGADFPAGVEIVQGDLTEPDSLALPPNGLPCRGPAVRAVRTMPRGRRSRPADVVGIDHEPRRKPSDLHGPWSRRPGSPLPVGSFSHAARMAGADGRSRSTEKRSELAKSGPEVVWTSQKS